MGVLSVLGKITPVTVYHISGGSRNFKTGGGARFRRGRIFKSVLMPLHTYPMCL